VKGKIHIVGIIPARYGSTRLPAKPLVDLCGKPMIQRVVEQALRSILLTRVVVATDDERIASVVKGFGSEVMMTPQSINTGSDRIAYVARKISDADIIVNIQGDEPLIAPRMIDEAIMPLTQDDAIQAGTLVKKITSAQELTSPHVVKAVLDNAGYAIYFSRSPIPYLRDDPEIEKWHAHQLYYKHIGIYVFRREFLLQFTSWEESTLERIEKLEQLRIIEHGYKIKTVVTEYDSIPVDTIEDAERVRQILLKNHAMSVV